MDQEQTAKPHLADGEAVPNVTAPQGADMQRGSDMRKSRPRILGLLSVALPLAILLQGCATLAGYPQDYKNETDMLTEDAPYLTAKVREIGDAPSNDARGGLTQQAYRDTVVYRRIEVIDNYYYQFEATLSGTHNGIDVAADLTSLALNGVGAVSGSAATKAALAAASGGVVGAKGAIDTDLFYQKTIQSLITQMRAAREQVLLRIENGLTNPVSKYSIDAALNDVSAYYIAGTLPGAIAQISANAGTSQTAAQNGIDALRKNKYTPLSATGERLAKWLYPGGDQTKPPDSVKLGKLTSWMNAYAQDPRLAQVPYNTLLRDPSLESDRAQAIANLKIP